MNPTYDFNGQVALVTGASTGMGFAAAKAFAESGAAVALADINVDALRTATDTLEKAGHKVIAIVCDVTDEAQAAAMVERTVAEFGRLDMAYNNAGILGPMGDITDETGEGFDQVNAVNLRGVWTCMKHELLQMRKQGSGAIVNCSSLGGLVGLAGRAAYHGSKHGVIGITKAAALDYAAKGIRVNAVCPGCIDTPMGDAIDPAAMKEFLKQQPIGRMGRPEEVAAAVLWLCSPAASLILGVALPVDGGFVAH
ncbi:SDR family oxidoreductase [Rhodanobacter sp. MP1X3]|nr:SDR family oxidoreductase [Rhodanobacter sp. MP1X3]MBB6242398.1 NAD(P)-dependent dehydrogenase (short-subunit alcohol dehydrogenase family) [Rhodanobacter sp. MP1X3]